MPAVGQNEKRVETTKRPRPHADADELEHAPARKPRVRVSEACEPCRKRKDRCNGDKPTCDNCQRTQRECSYRQTRKRGLRTGYVRALESLLGFILLTNSTADGWLSSLLDGNAEVPPANVQSFESLPQGNSIEPFLDAWRHSAVAKQVEHVLSTSEPTDDGEGSEQANAFDRKISQAATLAAAVLQQQSSSIDDNLQAVFLPSPMDTDAVPPTNITDDPPLPLFSISNEVPQVDPSLLASDAGTSTAIQPISHHGLPAETLSTDLPTNWEQLLEVYFATIHCWLPICEKHDLLRTAYLLATPDVDSFSASKVSHGDRAFLMTVLKYTASQGRHRTSSDFPTSSSDQGSAPSLFTKILNSFPEQAIKQELGHIRTLLIVVVSYLETKNISEAWSTIGRAVYALTRLGGSALGKRQAGLSTDPGITRTTLCCIALETIVADALHLRPYFQRSDIDQAGLLLTEGIEEWEPFKTHGASNEHGSTRQVPARVLSTFNSFIECIGILNDVIRARESHQGSNERSTGTKSVLSWLNRLASLESNVSCGNTAPNGLNFHWFAISLTQTLSELLNTGNPMMDAPNSHEKIRKLGKDTEGLLQDTREPIVPPTCAIYISKLRTSPLGGVGEWPQILEGLLFQLNSRLKSVGIAPIRSRDDQNHHTPSTEIGSLINSGGYRRSLNRQGSFICDPDVPSHVPSNATRTTGCTPSEVGVYNANLQLPAQAFGAAQVQRPSNVEPTFPRNFNDSILDMDHIPESFDDDGLFQRLADLDAADWHVHNVITSCLTKC